MLSEALLVARAVGLANPERLQVQESGMTFRTIERT